MGLPSINISVAMVKSELGAATNDVGRLCIHPNVNKWSRWKPVRHPSHTPLTVAQMGEAKGGLNVLEFSTIEDLIDFYKNNTAYDWQYLKPRGGAFVEPFRLDDFRNYAHDAVRFFTTEKLPSNIGVQSQIETFILPADVSLPILNMDYEVMGLQNAHWGVVMVWASPFDVWEATTMGWADNVLGTGNYASRAYIPTTGMVTGRTYRAYGFIGYPEDYPEPEKFIPIPDAFMGSFLYQTVLTIFLNPYRDSSGDIETAPQFINDGNDEMVLYNCSISLRYADNEPTDPLEAGEDIWDMGTITIPSNSSVAFQHQFIDLDSLPDFANRGGYLYFSNTTHFMYNKQEFID